MTNSHLMMTKRKTTVVAVIVIITIPVNLDHILQHLTYLGLSFIVHLKQASYDGMIHTYVLYLTKKVPYLMYLHLAHHPCSTHKDILFGMVGGLFNIANNYSHFYNASLVKQSTLNTIYATGKCRIKRKNIDLLLLDSLILLFLIYSFFPLL